LSHYPSLGGRVTRKKEVAYYAEVDSEVVVMARVDGYAMCRRPGALPFVVREKDLRPIVEAE